MYGMDQDDDFSIDPEDWQRYVADDPTTTLKDHSAKRIELREYVAWMKGEGPQLNFLKAEADDAIEYGDPGVYGYIDSPSLGCPVGLPKHPRMVSLCYSWSRIRSVWPTEHPIEARRSEEAGLHDRCRRKTKPEKVQRA